MKNVFAPVWLVLLISFFSIGGCGGSNSQFDGCDFNFSGIQNGPNFGGATTEWDCRGETETGQSVSGEFAFYTDGTGRDFSDPTTYERTDCRSVSYIDEFGGGEYINLDGSRSEGFLSFTRITGQEIFFECTLNTFEDEEDDDDEFF